MDLGFDGAATVVVGGSRGMGLATARCLAQEGARVSVVGRSRADVESAAEELARLGSPDAVGLAADVMDIAQVEAVFAQLRLRWNGELNALINTVGPNVQGTVEELTDDQWREAVDHGVLSIVHCVNAALPLLRSADWARIVNFSAHSTQRQTVSLVAYTAAKAMVTSVSKNLSLLLAKDEILVNVVSPGTFVTPALTAWARSVGIDTEDPYRLMEAIDTHYGHPAQLPRAGLPEEIGTVEEQRAPVVGERMQDGQRVVAGFDDFVQVADSAGIHGPGQGPVVPDDIAAGDEEPADEIGTGEIVVAAVGDHGAAEQLPHVFDETRLTASGRAGQHHRHVLLESPFGQLPLGAVGVVEIVRHRVTNSRWIWASTREALRRAGCGGSGGGRRPRAGDRRGCIRRSAIPDCSDRRNGYRGNR